MNNFLQSLRGLGTMRLTAIAGGGVAVLAFFIYMASRMANPSMELLYSNLELTDANQIVQKLQADKVPYELRKEGTEVWVPKDRKLDYRVKLAEQNLPSGGNVATGYEVFDKSDALGTTSFHQNINLTRAMEGELARTIKSISGVKAARVHLVMPKREMFSRETQDPSASVILRMEGARLTKAQVGAVQHMVAAAVPRLKPSRISIVDDKGTLLARGFENDQEMLAETADEKRLATEQRLQTQIQDLLERSLGAGKVRSEVSAEMDFDRVATTEEVYDPESRVVRSQVTVEEGENTTDGENPSVSVTQNLPDAGTSAASGSKSSSSQNRTQETVNYEISKTVRNHVKELGSVKRLSVAVLVDGIYTSGENGQKNYQPRDDQQMEKIASLVRSAIGYDANRGDQVEVINMQFAQDEIIDDTAQKIFGMDRDFVEKVATNLGLSVVAILFLLLVLKPLVSRAIETMASQGRGGLLDGGAPALLSVPAPAPGMLTEEMEDIDELIDIDKVEGRVKASSIRKIGEIVEKHPDEALSIIRSWMYQDT